ncbi:tRNA uridine-5-carboxymethylaminomethyl(34) synthesis GTPase MnmE [Campylobacter sp. LR291e]|uniref:tRNA uridine-5-carboxymethylaminomethyl(34) synthesis GTPase MnmE n=1 Tax=Campylobacter sp. LR291e TaxID=2593546 RepID=UPI0012384459|nr:tRNA uridine-5-carboxymethylaminomethyl(34) synthesis GTPase MnmE [Campylobacter sp. LR291e]KAA6230795.1 tRNA uridine-5-carboxymethylaminomethyl(34) synthesis GTPase MnmE [Campylobacter sp. LR291e]
MNETIAAISTSHGISSISIVRLSGDNALSIALKLTHKTNLKERYATLCKLYDENNDFIDEAIVLYFKAPFSFSGEDIVEFQVHGGVSVSEVVLENLITLGARLARPGEFSKRACLNGKMSILKALNIQDLIFAKSSFAAKIIARNLEGKLGLLLEKIRQDLVKTLAFVETSIDYADDDLPKDLLNQIQAMCKENADILNEIYTISQSKKGLIDGFKVAIVGKPNVGKSSLLNAFLSYERAIVSQVPGTTRDRVEESFCLDGFLLRIIDTAGIRNSDDLIENKGIELSKKSIDEADIIIALFDYNSYLSKEDENLYELLKDNSKKIFWVLNKCDLKQNFKTFKNLDFIKISTKHDINALKNALVTYLKSLDSNGVIVHSLYVINALKSASEAILRAKNLINEENLELFAFELNLAIQEIAKFTKDFNSDEILDEMFSNFCLGK